MNNILDVVTGGMAVLREIDNQLYVGLYEGETRQLLFSREKAKIMVGNKVPVFTAEGHYNGSLIRVCDELVPVSEV